MENKSMVLVLHAHSDVALLAHQTGKRASQLALGVSRKTASRHGGWCLWHLARELSKRG